MADEPLLIMPYLNLATICERYIHQPDGALTLFRIVDRFTVTGQTAEMPPTLLTFTLVVNFRAGNFVGNLDLNIKIIDPSMNPIQQITVPLPFEQPPERAAQMLGDIRLTVKEAGLYWIVIVLNKQECTRIPIRVVYQRSPTVVAGGGVE